MHRTGISVRAKSDRPPSAVEAFAAGMLTLETLLYGVLHALGSHFEPPLCKVAPLAPRDAKRSHRCECSKPDRHKTL